MAERCSGVCPKCLNYCNKYRSEDGSAHYGEHICAHCGYTWT